MARTGSSSKFVPVNLNNSYGQTLPVSNGGASASSSLGRSRSFSNSYGGMVTLSRSTKVSSSSSSSTAVSVSSRASKLAVPRPVNLPSLRREHSGNDPTIALVGSVGSSGWTKQTGDETVDAVAPRSDGFKGDSSSWGNRAPGLDASTHIAERRLLSAGRQSAYSPPGPGDNGIPASGLVSPVTKAVVFRGEDFPTLQAAAVPFSPSLPPPLRSKDLQHKQLEKHVEAPDEQKTTHQQVHAIGDDSRQSNHSQQLQPAQPVRTQVRGTFPDQVDTGADRGGAYSRGPSPLIRLTHTSNWADDERETLSGFRTQESVQSEWAESNKGFRTAGNWPSDHSADIDFRRPMPRSSHPGRNDADSSMHTGSAMKGVYGKDGDPKRGPLNGSRFELDYRGDFDRMNNNLGRNDFLKRGWSFSAAESTLNRDARFANSNNVNERESYTNGRAYLREGNNFRQDTSGRDMFTRDGRPGLYFQDAGQRHDAKFGKDVFIGRQGFPGGLPSPGPRAGQRPGFSYNGSDVALPSKPQSGVDYKRDKRASGIYGQVYDEDPFLGDAISTRPTPFYVASQPKMKKDAPKDNDYRDPARESFEAELERVEKMLEQERQRAVEEREKAIELARKEQEEQERLAREEEELRLKLEEEEREAADRAQREAEEAARKVEEARKAREEEKRMAELEEERRKEAARRKLLELEERMAKRESERRREEAPRKEMGSTLGTLTGEGSIEGQDSGTRNNETEREFHWKSLPSGKVDQHSTERVLPMVQLPVNSSSLPSILRSPRLSPYAKEENSSLTGARLAQTWKREALDNGHDPRSAQRGPVNSFQFQNERPQKDHEDQQRGASFRNQSVRKSPVRSTHTQNMASIDPSDADERNWWGRDTLNKSQEPLANYPYSADAAEYPSSGRLRQSLPKQPRVLPPPPAQSIPRKQAVQSDGTHSGASGFGIEHIKVAPTPKEDYTLTTDVESTVCHEAGIDDSLVADQQVSEQFDSVPSEEVVLSDAGSQFSDDTIEDVADQVYQEQELHSDAVSETYTEGEVDEISDLTEAQESSEDFESQKPIDWEACNGVQKADIDGESFEQAMEDVHGCFQGQYDVGKEGSMTLNKEQEQVDKVLDECRDSGENIANSCLVEDVERGNVEDLVHIDDNNECVAEEAGKQTVVPTEEPVGNAEELPSEKIVQDQVMQPLLHQAPFLPVGTGDATQIRHLEGVSSRQSLVQQFQQPFSFMAVPLPQSNTLNHVGASLPMLSSVHALPNQQELPFHLQLGLLPGMPLMPNAIQIGSIQMPLHIHPQIPQLTHLHGQQAPVFQFGQIGPSLSISQPLPMTHMSQPAVQMHHPLGQGSLSQHHFSQAEFVNVVETANDSVKFNQHARFGDVAAAEDVAAPSTGHNLAFKEGAEVKQGASGNSEGSAIVIEREVQLPLVEPETQSTTTSVSKLDAQTSQKTSTEDKLESSWVGDGGQADHNARPDSRPSRGGRRRSNGPRYQGILGRGRGRFHGGQNYFHQAPHLSAESWPEAGIKRFSRGKTVRRSYRRTEYRVREPLPLFDGESAAAEIVPGPAFNVEDSKEGGGYRYVKRGSGNHSRNAGDENGQLSGAGSRPLHTVAKADQPANQSITATTSKGKGLPRQYEVDNAEDAPFRTGVVCVFEQPGIETPNDKDDFIKVRSKRQLLRELREQREKESKTKSLDSGSREQVGKKHQRLFAKAGINSGMAGANLNKNIVKRRSTRSVESAPPDRKANMPSFSNGATGISSASSTKRNLTSPKPGRAITASKAAIMDSENLGSFTHDNHISEQSTTTAAWGGQRSNQEVVSLTQIQLEEAMKPFRLDAPFSESTHISEKVMVALEPGLPCSSALSAEKTGASIKVSGPLSSLLAGEKIQFGAVTSPTLIPPTPLSAVRTGSPLGFGSDSSHVPSHTSSFVTNFLESPLDVAFSLKGDSSHKDDGFEGKVADLEAEAEAAASAVAAAAISNEDSIESHSNMRVSEINASCVTISPGLPAANPLTVQVQNASASDNPIAVALPADLSVETPPSLFQGSSMTLSNSSGFVLQSLPGGAPTFPCMEMGPLLGGPVFNFGPREDASLASMEPGLSGWQQRHVGTPDSFYGAPPFLSPAGLSSIQGHPHMLVYANPYTPVGQFGQLGVSFMGAAYHPSGKQPDWTHIPMPSASSGALAVNDGDLNAGSCGLMASQHLNGASNLIPTQRIHVAGSSGMPVAAPPNLFDTGFAASFQVPQMDGLVQSHWSKAPAPPVHSVPISGSTLPIQNLPMSRPAVDLNMQVHPSRVLPNQAGQLSHLNDANSGFHQLPVMNPVSSSSFSSADAGSQFPDELGLGDSMPTVSTLQSDAGGPLSDTGHVSSFVSGAASGIKMQRGRHPSRSSQGLYGANGSNSVELSSVTNSQDQIRSGHGHSESQSKYVGQFGSPGLRTNSLHFAEQRASKQALPRESAGGEWPRNGQRKGASGRPSTSDRGGSVLPSKLKQIYVAKPAADSRKVSAACS
eukprot:c25015_g3_i1 orf=264-7748(+)